MMDIPQRRAEPGPGERTTQSIQDSFLNTARREKTHVTIYLISGVKLTGRIKSFDKYSLVLETGNQEQLIFKHAISTVVTQRGHGAAVSAASTSRGQAQPAPQAETKEA